MTTEIFEPSPDQRKVLRDTSEDFILSGDGFFATLQGEGVTAGAPAVFMRLQNCNLHCGADMIGWRCDAWYTWDKSTREYWTEARLVSVDNAAKVIHSQWSQNFLDENQSPPRLVITGGEPLLQQCKIARLLPKLQDWQIEIETNGTINPLPELENCQINCSPKLATSGNNLSARRRTEVLRRITHMPNYWLKFVIAHPDEDLPEVDEIVAEVCNGNYERVILMPEGVHHEKILAAEAVLKAASKERGASFGTRNHIYWFGDKRAT